MAAVMIMVSIMLLDIFISHLIFLLMSLHEMVVMWCKTIT
jgi:hypothetical protein